MSDEMEKQSVEETTEAVDAVETTETVEVEENVAETADAVTEETPVEAVNEEVSAEAPAETQAVEAEAEEQAELSAQEQESTPAKAAKEKTPKKQRKLFIAAAVLLAFVIVIANAPKIGNAAVKLFTSPAGYFQHVLKKSSDEVVEQFAKGYDIALENMSATENVSSETELGVTFGKDVREMLEDATDMDFEWMEKVSFLVNADSTKDAYKFDLGVALNDKRLISLLLMANMKDKTAYMQVPELNESYLGVDLEEFLDDNGMDMDDINEASEMYEKFYKALPKASKVEKVLKRYSELAISCVEDVKQDKEEVKVDEITNKFTVLEATIDEGTLQDMLEVIVKELKKDKDIKEIIYDVLETQEDADADEVYDEFLDLLDELEDEIDSLDDEKFEIVVKLYVNNEGEIMGVVVELEEVNTEISNFIVQKGSKYAYEFEMKVNGVKVVVDGTGKMTSSKLSGDFKVKAAGLKVLDFSLKDVKIKDLEDGYFNGTVSVSLGSATVKALEEEIDDFPFDLADLVLELKGKSSKNKSEMTVSLYEKEDLLGAFSINSKVGKAGKIKSPKDKEVVMIEDEDDLMDWVGDIDFDKFIESLEGKLDDDLLDMLEDLIDGDISLPSFDDDYYNDDDYWYDDDYYYDDDYWYDDYEDDWY